MAVKPILPFGDPVLRQISEPVTAFGNELIRLLDDLTDTLHADAGGAGLAAPQIGVSKRVIVIDCGDGLIELVNPQLLEMRGEQTGPEGCLSYPKFNGTVTRAKQVKVKYFNRRGKEMLLEGADFLARCIQHEMDHLNGILYIDRVQGDYLYQDETRQRVKLQDVLSLSNPSVPCP